MKNNEIRKIDHPEKLGSYFKIEAVPLALVTVSGLLYNVGMTFGPYFEGLLAQCLYDIIKGEKTANDMIKLSVIYLAVILFVQVMRCFKRFYVRRFANDTSRNMRHMIYNSLVNKSHAELENQSIGHLMTRAVSDVDTCVEGLRKFTTELFDTGIALIAYLVMLFSYDFRLTIISCAFIPAAYIIAGRLKKIVASCSSEYKKSAGRLNNATLDRISNALTYRIAGRDSDRDSNYEGYLDDYEKKAVRSNLLDNTMQPLYSIIAMAGIIPLILFGSANVMGTGWTTWNIAAFTTFLACFNKMAVKSSHAAKLFNSVQKAQVSWNRIKPMMHEYIEQDEETNIDFSRPMELEVSNLSFAYPEGEMIFDKISFNAEPGQIIGVTGPVASGKSTFGKAFLCEYPYEGSIKIGGLEVSELSGYERSKMISYMGHQPELISGSINENICLGDEKSTDIQKSILYNEEVYCKQDALKCERSRADSRDFINMVCMDRDLSEMRDGADTYVGDGGVRLSGGQQGRTALARTLYHAGRVIILDDPLSAVDKKTESEIMHNLRQSMGDRIIILISHRLDLFDETDKVLWIDSDKWMISEHETMLKENADYSKLFYAQTNKNGGD